MKITRMADIEFRSDTEGRVEGLACVFNQRTDLGWFTEEIDSHAFDGCDMSDVVLNFNHDNNLILAGTRNGSLDLRVEDSGLFQSAQIVDTTTGEDVLKLVKNGLINKMSFAFSVSPDGEEWRTEGNKEHRIIRKIDKLYDVSLVTFPAYSQTFAYARNDELAQAHQEKLKERREKQKEVEEILNEIGRNS